MRRNFWRTIVAALLVGTTMTAGLAADFPTKPIRIIVPYPAGGSTDIAARAVADALSRRIGQTVFVENKAGAGTLIGAEAVAHSQPDGYTLLYGTNATTTSPLIVRNTQFNFQRDLVPVSLVLVAPLILLTNPDLPVHNVTELIALLRAKPGSINVGFPGIGTVNHLASILFNREVGVKTELIPYKGNAEVQQGLLRGDINLAFDAIISSKAYVDSGKVRALAMSSATRSSAMPELPTIAASGLPGFEAIFWNGVLAPAGTPPAVISRLNAEIDAVVKVPEMAAKLRALGADPAGGSVQNFERRIASDLDKWGRLIREMNIRAD